MKTCSNCGIKRNSKDKFCLNCGFKHEDEYKPSAPDNTDRSRKAPKKKKAMLITVMALLVILIGTHVFLKSKYNSSKVLIEMNQAYTQSDYKEFFSHFTFDDHIMNDAESFYSFVEEEGWKEIRDQMKSEVELLENEGLSNIITDSTGNKFITVSEEPILFGLYNEVSFLIHPVTVEATILLDKTAIEIHEKTVTGNKDEKIEIGKFIPGNYKWKATAASDYSPIENSGTAEIRGNGSNLYELNPALEAGMVTVTSDLAGAVLWIDGKSTEKTVTEMKTLGPVPFNKTVEISAEAKDENDTVVKAEPILVEGETAHITFDFVQQNLAAEKSEKLEAKQRQKLLETHEMMLHDLIASFRYEFESALNYGDFSYISSFFPSASPIQAEYIEKMEEHYNSEEYYEYDFISTVVTDIQAINSTTMQVNTDEVFLYTLDGNDFRYHKTKRYTVNVQSGYYITSIEELSTDIDEE